MLPPPAGTAARGRAARGPPAPCPLDYGTPNGLGPPAKGRAPPAPAGEVVLDPLSRIQWDVQRRVLDLLELAVHAPDPEMVRRAVAPSRDAHGRVLHPEHERVDHLRQGHFLDVEGAALPPPLPGANRV